MSYETGTATDIENLVGKLFTFATNADPGWTQDELDNTNNYGTMHIGSDLYVSFRWDTTPETDLGLYQSLGWTASMEPHEQDDDSGNGDTGTPIDTERRVNFQDTGPYTAYHFFASDGAPRYIHAVVEVTSGVFRHFGYGTLNKFGDWTGGEYCYGHFWSQSTLNIDEPKAVAHSFGLDGSHNLNTGATLHVESLGSIQGANEKWMIFGSTTNGGTDTATEDRQVCYGGGRGGWWAYHLGWLEVSTINAYKPLIPIPVMVRDLNTAPDSLYYLGEQPDVALVNMANFNPGDTITVGSDTWFVFPWVRKQKLEVNTEESWNAGIAYKQIPDP